MFKYLGVTCFYLGAERWRVKWKGWDFHIIAHRGISEMMENIERWVRM